MSEFSYYFYVYNYGNIYESHYKLLYIKHNIYFSIISMLYAVYW